MSKTTIPGIKGKHRWISENCIAMKGVRGAVDEAVEDARQFLMDCIPRWFPKHVDTKFHIVVTVEGPESEDIGAGLFVDEVERKLQEMKPEDRDRILRNWDKVEDTNE